MDNQLCDAASPRPALRDHYGQMYGRFTDDIFASVRREAFGEDLGQNSWHTLEEHELLRSWLDLDPASRLLDVACGSGGPTLRLARQCGCHVTGIDLQAEGIAAAKAAAERDGVAEHACFLQHDASQPLPFADAAFDAVLCIEAINHLADRLAAVREWWRVLKPGGRLVIIDAIIMTGPLTNEEIAVRSALGFYVFVPLGYNEQVLVEAGFTVDRVEDRTADMALVASRWYNARASREATLREIEGDERYEKQQAFFAMCALLAGERRLSRYAFLARKPGGTV